MQTQSMEVQNTAASNIADLQRFLTINAGTKTGDVASYLGPVGRGIRSLTDADYQELEAITSRLAPLQRQAGSGAMSDRDVDMYRRSVPNVTNDQRTNTDVVNRLVRGSMRIMDYESNRLKAYSEGDPGQFASEWSRYVGSVSFMDGGNYVSFEQWQRMPKIGKDGRPR
jgi:hypothetical protein